MSLVVRAIKRTYRLDILVGFLALFALIHFLPPLVPDYLRIREVENIRGVLFGLLSLSVAIASLSITFIVLIHNFYFKAVRRNAMAVVFKSGWVRFIVSAATGTTLFVFSTWFGASSPLDTADTTRVYLSGSLVLGMLFLQLPLMTIVLQDSLSLRTIKKLATEISSDVIERFETPKTEEDETYAIIEEYEDNPLIQLRDIAVEAVRGKDWTIPQTVVGHCYDALIGPITADTPEREVELKVFAWSHLCERVGITAIENDHTRNLEVVVRLIFRSTLHLCELRRYENHPAIAETLTDLLCALLRKDGYDEYKEKAIVTYLEFMAMHLKRVNLTDDELPTRWYIKSNPVPGHKVPIGNDPARTYWYYITTKIVEQFRNILELAIVATPSIPERSLEWPIGSSFSLLLDEKGLTRHQQDDFLVHIYLDTEHLLRDRMRKSRSKAGLFFVETLSRMIKDKRPIGRMAFSNFIQHLRAKSEGDGFIASMERQDLFTLGEQIAEKEPPNELMIGCIDAIVHEGIKYASEEADQDAPQSDPFSSSMRYRLKRLYELLEEKKTYSDILAKDRTRIMKLIQDVEA